MGSADDDWEAALLPSKTKAEPWRMDTSTAARGHEMADEAARDPGAHTGSHHFFGEMDFQGHRAHNIYQGVQIPVTSHKGRRSHGHRHHRHHHHRSSGKKDDRPGTPPAQRVQFILGEEEDDGHEAHAVFSEMVELVSHEPGDMEWKEVARWVKFEEDVEEGGNRWSKPHVATLSLHSLFELRSLLTNGTVILDMDATNLDQLADLLVEQWANVGLLPLTVKDQVKDALLLRRRHQHERRREKEGSGSNVSKLPIIRSLAEIGRSYSSSKNFRKTSKTSPNDGTTQQKNGKQKMRSTMTWAGSNGTSMDDSASKLGEALSAESGGLEPSATAVSLQNGSMADLPADSAARANMHFMRKLPADVEASNIMIGELDYLERPMMAFIRLANSTLLGDLNEVPIPTRFLFILLTPSVDPADSKETSAGKTSRYREIGRSMATLMSDEIFHVIAYKAKKREHLLAGLDEFLDSVTILPPGEWDPSIRIEPPDTIPSQEPRKHPEQQKEHVDEEELEIKLREEMGLTRTGRLFGGLLNDVKRKLPWYASDFTDAFSMQCVASWIFLYFACLTPIITFGGLLGEATGNNMAAMESLVSGAVVGIAYALFSGQPLTILGSTGPVLVFETILYDFCQRQDWNYLSFRFCIGVWVGIILITMVALDLSYTVCYITRFTEENFACLIAFIFIYKAIEKLMMIGDKYPINMTGKDPDYSCFCNSTNNSIAEMLDNEDPYKGKWGLLAPTNSCQTEYQGELWGEGCTTQKYYPDIFLMSILLFVGTFTLSVILKGMRTAPFFPTTVRVWLSDFAVIIAIGSMALTDYLSGVETPKLMVPGNFAPTLPDRGWIVTPFGDRNPFWTPIAAVVPALLAVILIFMDQQISAVIVNRKENKLKKGCGYHLDLFILAILIIICSMMGIPWFVAATVLSINHVNSLKMESECAAPGEKAQFLGVREQRLTPLLIFLTIGLSVFLTSVLKHIPMPVLFGVFLYMGFSSLKGLQFWDRILIMFMPAKYQPDYSFLRKVPLKRVHFFTIIQLICFAMLWIIKSFKQTSILFPIMLVVMIGVRKILDFEFSARELRVLDDLMPEFKRRVIEEKEGDDEGEEEEDDKSEGKLGSLKMGPSGNLSIPLANGNVMKIPACSINISEEMNKSGVWKHVNSDSDLRSNGKPIDKTKNRAVNEKGSLDEHKRLSHVPEEEEDDVGITIKVDPPSSLRMSPASSEKDVAETHV